MEETVNLQGNEIEENSESSFPFPWLNIQNDGALNREANVKMMQSETYCICRSNDSTSFMIACDFCDYWFHANCVGLKEEDCHSIENYYCDSCRIINPHLEITYEKKQPFLVFPEYTAETNQSCEYIKKRGKKRKRKFTLTSRTKRKAKTAIKSKRTKAILQNNNGQDAFSFHGHNITNNYEPSSNLFGEKIMEDASSLMTSISNVIVLKSRSQRNNSSKSQKQRRNTVSDTIACGSMNNTEKNTLSRSSSSESLESDPDLNSDLKSISKTQCLGISCTNAAQPESKYCSTECGINLAILRIRTILPERLQKFRTHDSVGEKLQAELDKVIKEKWLCQSKRDILEHKRKNLEDYINAVKEMAVVPTEEKVLDKTKGEGCTACVTCGQEFVSRNISKHMEKCWRRQELKSSCGSYGRSDICGAFPIFCDSYNKDDGTFCKRLQVLCPEHSREAKISDTEICGAPLTNELIANDLDKICMIAKKKCSLHVSWDKIRRAEIDMERYREWRQYELLVSTEKGITDTKANRGDLLGLLLHSTKLM